ncbi:Prefoldin subunit 4 [Galemys pyrenaicus]|uniref:Prefoldin subunit 4 n=1 Tax=Galemys pyrenaicus TaxID=202257 RepID=A0A8J6DJE5_GALPY|nr:Prefoldin subunit 4 [Galemys pyrenaicus]
MGAVPEHRRSDAGVTAPPGEEDGSQETNPQELSVWCRCASCWKPRPPRRAPPAAREASLRPMPTPLITVDPQGGACPFNWPVPSTTGGASSPIPACGASGSQSPEEKRRSSSGATRASWAGGAERGPRGPAAAAPPARALVQSQDGGHHEEGGERGAGGGVGGRGAGLGLFLWRGGRPGGEIWLRRLRAICPGSGAGTSSSFGSPFAVPRMALGAGGPCGPRCDLEAVRLKGPVAAVGQTVGSDSQAETMFEPQAGEPYAEHFPAAEDVNVTFEDQQKINKFARNTSRITELKEEIDVKKKQLQNLEDACEDIMLADDDCLMIPYQIGDVFISHSQEETQDMLEEAKKNLQEEIDALESRVESIQRVLADLKVQLYAKFGSNINLEADETCSLCSSAGALVMLPLYARVSAQVCPLPHVRLGMRAGSQVSMANTNGGRAEKPDNFH